jgi:hypothetical protein
MQALSNQVTPKVSGRELEFLAIELGLKMYEFRVIESNHPLDVKRQTLDVLEGWKRNDENYTWKFLIKALKAPAVNLGDVAKELEQWVIDNVPKPLS